MTIKKRKDVMSLFDKVYGDMAYSHGDTFELIGQTVKLPNLNTETMFDRLFIEKPQFLKFTGALIRGTIGQDPMIGPYDLGKYMSMLLRLNFATSRFKEQGLGTRQAILIFDPTHCFQSIQFLVREDTLTAIVNMRSCNMEKNFCFDVAIAVWLCEELIDMLPGAFNPVFPQKKGTPRTKIDIVMNIGSLHIFKQKRVND